MRGEAVEISETVGIGEKDALAVYSALRDMVRSTDRDGAC
jgi:hypothetical protein